jgi:hypothetical protein
MRHGRRKDQCSDPRNQAEVEDNTNLLAAGQSGKKDDRGERKCAESEATTGRKRSMHACKKACTREATAGRKNNMCT